MARMARIEKMVMMEGSLHASISFIPGRDKDTFAAALREEPGERAGDRARLTP
jgi:hypothetical protein